MKKILLTAAMLSLGTSAYAWTMQEEAHSGGALARTAMQAGAWTAKAASYNGSEALAPKMLSGTAKTADDGGMVWAESDIKSKAMVGGVQTASADMNMSGAKMGDTVGAVENDGMMWAEADMKSKAMVGGVQTASADWGTSGAKTADDGGLTFADADMKSKEMVGGIQTADAGMGAGAYKGEGGPLESGAGYPACDPGPGDDRCIQLYERGVRERLAMWQGANSGMGGPLEPVADANAKTPDSDDVNDSGAPVDKNAAAGTTMSGTGSGHMNHDMSNGSDAGMAAGQKPATSAATNPGIGGPIEARSNYPVCSRTVTDSCIQLSGRSRGK